VRFATRLVAGTLLVLILAVAVLLLAAERSLRQDLVGDIERSLVSEAGLIREALPPDSTTWAETLRRLAAQNNRRITIVDPGGRVLADSDLPTGQLPAIEARLEVPEIREALGGRIGVATRPSESDNSPRLYVAVPGGPGAIRVAASLGQVDEIVRRAQAAVASAAVLALLVGGVLALVAGRSIARPLTGITTAARAIAAGSPPRFPRSGIPDIDALVQALRQMHRQLADRFDELRKEQAESAALVESMVEGVIAADDRGRIVTANPAARRLLGYDQLDPLPDLAELFRVKAAREVVDAVLDGTPVQDREVELDGLSVLLNARPLPAGGAVLVMHDLTEIRKLEMIRRDFVANVSHELKTPLTSISGYAETLLSLPPDPEMARVFLGTILGNAQRMQRLVDDLLDLSRIESGRWQPEPAEVEIGQAARDAWTEVSGARPESQRVQFTTEIGADAERVCADLDALRQVLTNLLENSVRYTPAGGAIACLTRREERGVAISVRDNGSGITREHLPRIFERFYRADAARSRDEGGTGLGLAIVKHLVEAHGGRVSAESERGRGTTVTCWFPDA
jgi:two-component system phosphate regulon sensor histidine kinase PhoR